MYFPEELRIFWYFPVVFSRNACPNATRERKSNKDCVSTRATAGLHTYFIRRSATKFSFLLKTTTLHQIYPDRHLMFVCVRAAPSRGMGCGCGLGCCVLVFKNGGVCNFLVTHYQPAARIQYHPHFAFPNNPIPGGKHNSPQPPPPLFHLPHLRTIVTKRTKKGTALTGEEEAEPRRSDVGETILPSVIVSCRRGCSS